MGSFASSLHVKEKDAGRVAATLAELFAQSGWRPTQKLPDSDATWGIESSLRAVQISAPRQGWVSLLDTDLMGAHTLAPQLAKALTTHAIFFFVNDSDGWSYLLANPKGNVSEFDSEDGADDDDFDGSDLVEAAAAASQLQSLMHDGSMLQKFQDIQAQMIAGAPAEIREAEARIKSGQGTPADLQRYQVWAMQEMPKHMAQFKSMLSGLLNLPRIAPETRSKNQSERKRTKAERAARQKRLDAIRPLFATGVNDEQVQAVLDKQATFAEDILSEFLPLLGIADFYANLSYRYLRGTRSEELTPHNIQFVHHLRFETSRPPQLSLS